MAKKLKKIEKKKRNRKSLFDVFSLPNSDSTINLVVFLLIVFGSFMIVSTNVGQTTSNSRIVLTTLTKQMIFVVASYILMWAAHRIFTLPWFSGWQRLLILLATFVMALPLLFEAQGGSRAWIRLGPLSLQPSEFMKPFIIVMIACAVYMANEYPKRKESFLKYYWAPLITYLMLVLLLMLQRDTGTLVIITMIAFVCVLIPNVKSLRRTQNILKFLFVFGLISAVILFGITDIGTELIAKTPFSHIATRIENFKNPYTDLYGQGYQPANALYGIANADFFGKGIGGSARKFGYLTQAENDYIFAVLIEETGIFGLSGLMILYSILFIRLTYYALKTKNTSYKVILMGNATYLFMHFFLNVAGVTALIPMTGVPLLFISSGGSALMSICLMIGISQKCISLIRTKEMRKKEIL